MPCRRILFSAFLTVLAACSPSEEPPKTASAASAVTAPAPAASAAVSDAPAASDTAPTQAAAKLGTQSQAQWQPYRCSEGNTEARYYQGKEGATAQVKYKGSTYTLAYSPELSEDDLNTFSNGRQSWTTAKFADDFYRESDGFLVLHERPDPNASDVIVDNLVLQNCQPEPK